MADLRALFAMLPTPPLVPTEAPLVTALPVPERPCFRVARNGSNHPLLLLESTGMATSAPPLALEHLRIEYARPCRVQSPEGTLNAGVFTIFACTSADPVLRDYFLLVGGALVSATPQDPQPGAVAQAIETMAELFRALQAPARSSVQGLWGEVFLIAESRDHASVARAWRVAIDDRFDFSSQASRVEVKSTRGVNRMHHFSLEQLRPPTGVRGFVASLRVEYAGGGTSIEDLLTELRASLSNEPDLLFRVESVVATTLGIAYRTGIAERYDREAALTSLAYYRMEDVPSIHAVLPPAVTDVRFRSDLSAVAPVQDRTLMTCGDALLQSLPPPNYKTS